MPEVKEKLQVGDVLSGAALSYVMAKVFGFDVVRRVSRLESESSVY